MKLLNTILNIIFPKKCIACEISGSDFCFKCLANIPPTSRPSENWIFSLYDYRHPPIKKALWLLKYKGKKSLANIFAELMYGKMLEELSELKIMRNFNEPLLIPIPMSNKKRRERGFNQTELLCQELVRLDLENSKSTPHQNIKTNPQPKARLPAVESFALEKNILLKIKDTEPQARIKNRKQRLENLLDSFMIKNEKKELIKGKNIILIDDITTTGATLNEIRKTLKKAGAKKIIAFTIAH